MAPVEESAFGRPAGPAVERPADVDADRGGLAQAGAAAWRLLGLLLVAGVVLWVLGVLRVVVLPFALALVLTGLLLPPTDWLDARTPIPRGLLAAGVLLLVVGLFVGALALLGTAVAGSFEDVGRALARGVRDLGRFVVSLPIGVTHDDWSRALAEPLEAAGPAFGDMLGRVRQGAAAVVQVGTETALMLAFAFFLAKDGRGLWDAAMRQFPDRVSVRLREAGSAAWGTLGGYLIGVAIIGTSNAVMMGVALLVLGVPLVLPLALLTLIGSFIPFVGPVVSGALAMLVALSAGGPKLSLLVLGATVLVQQVEGNLLQPFVMGRVIALHPVVVLAGVTAGIVLLGIPGAFLAVPVLAASWAAWTRWRTSAIARPRPRVRGA